MRVDWDMQPFQNAFKLYAAESKRDLQAMTNAAAFDIARWAIEETQRAKPSEIDDLTKEEWWPKYIAKRIARGVSVSFGRKDNKRRVRFAGAYTRAQARSVSRKIIAARKRARTFIAAGWLPAVQEMARHVFGAKGAARTRAPGGVRQVGRKKGFAHPARQTWNPTAWIINTALNAKKFSSRPNPMPIAQAGLRKAFARKTRDFMNVVNDRMRRTARKHSARR